MNVPNYMLDFSTIVSVNTANDNYNPIYGGGFFLKKTNTQGYEQYFLFTSYSLLNKAKEIKFAAVLKNGNYEFINIPNFNEILWYNKYDVARLDVSNILKNINPNHLIDKDIICKNEVEHTSLLEELFIIGNSAITYPSFNHERHFITATRCSNATTLNAIDLGFFTLNLKYDSRFRGSPVYITFDKNIRLVGMVNELGKIPCYLTSAAPAEAILGLLEFEPRPKLNSKYSDYKG